MNSFPAVMKFVNYLAPVNCRNCILNGLRSNASTMFNNSYLLGSSVRIFTPYLARNFTFYASLYKESTEDFSKGFKGNKRKNQSKSPTVSVIDESNVERVMSFFDAEKLAKSRKMKLVKLETGNEDKIKYKLEKSLEVAGITKSKLKNTKKIYMTEEIHAHDVEIKIKQMLRFLEKGLDVVCVVESLKKDKQDSIIGILHNSKLKECNTGKKGTSRGINLTYAANMFKKTGEHEEEQNMENQSSK